MAFDDFLGRHVALKIRRFASPGAFLAIDEEEDILLIGSEIPAGAKVGDEVEVFVHFDSDERAIATSRRCKLEIGQVAFLEVTDIVSFGAFVDWGLAKELLVPRSEQTAEMHVGSRYAIGLYLDDSGRLAGTMRVSEMLDRERASFRDDEWVDGEAWRNDPDIGLFVIVEKEHVGLVPRTEPHGLSRGEAARFRVTNVLHDGKIELSLRKHAHEELSGDAEKIFAFLARPNAPVVSDKASPDDIRDWFGLSKKAFKRAVGRLLKEGRVLIDAKGNVTRKS